MKILLGIIVGAGLMFGGVAFARESGMHGIVTVSQGSGYIPTKFYDYDNGVVCYSMIYSSSPSISCLHN